MSYITYEYRLFGFIKLWRIGGWRNKAEARAGIRWFMKPFIRLVKVYERQSFNE